MSKNKKALNQPLSKQEINELHDFLWQKYQDDEKALTLEMVDGFFCGLAINPEIAMPSEWLEIVFDTNKVFKSEKEANRILSLLFRHYNRVNYLIQHCPKDKEISIDTIYTPMVFEYNEADSEYPFAEHWATGFRIGIGYCQEEWDKALNEETEESEGIAAVLTLILLLELGHNLGDEEQKINDEQRNELYLNLPVAVYELYDYWQEKRKQQPRMTQVKQKIGRNDSCPCGSGKKYKKCCEGQVSATVH